MRQTAADSRELPTGWNERLDARIDALIKMRDELTGCIGCGCLSLKSCRLRNPNDALSTFGPGARLLERQ
jgi:MerR family redox-sensitive transcriptional activator SoxR